MDLINYQSIVDFFIKHYPDIISIIGKIVGYLVAISIPVCLVLFIGIIFCIERLKVLRKKEDEIFNAKVDMGYDEVHKPDQILANKWKQVLIHIESDNENDWRQAIIEADIMLGDLLTKLGYKGEGIGEQLKRVEKGDFKTLNEAWEAHKVRNIIAHDGSDFELNEHEARRVINLYRKVFEEFYHI